MSNPFLSVSERKKSCNILKHLDKLPKRILNGFVVMTGA